MSEEGIVSSELETKYVYSSLSYETVCLEAVYSSAIRIAICT